MELITAISLDIKSCKFRLDYEGFKFAYNSASELAELMHCNCDYIQNPYEPQTMEYEEFNETVYSLQNRKVDKVVLS